MELIFIYEDGVTIQLLELIFIYEDGVTIQLLCFTRYFHAETAIKVCKKNNHKKINTSYKSPMNKIHWRKSQRNE